MKTFVTFRVAGDTLDPDEVTAQLNIQPTHAHKQGEEYSTGRSKVVPSTGVWLFSTDRITPSLDFYTHLRTAMFLLGFFRGPDISLGRGDSGADFGGLARLLKLKQMLEQKSLTATMTFFWHGGPRAAVPEIPEGLAEVFSLIPIAIEIDFDRDEEMSPRRRRAA